jgi:hypothetical protein
MGGRVEEAARGKRRKREREINVRWNVGVRASDEQNRARVIEVSIYKWTRCPIFYISQSQAGRRSRKKSESNSYDYVEPWSCLCVSYDGARSFLQGNGKKIKWRRS